MATAPFKNNSEEVYADHLVLTGLGYEYERAWGEHKPDFTIYQSDSSDAIIAVADVKDLRHTPDEEARLAAGEMIGVSRDPSLRTRRQIHDVWKQFEACTDYPCILILASGGDSLPDPLFVMAAMLGDFTISLSVPGARGNTNSAIAQSFGENGKMVNKDGNPRNARISGIGLIRTVRPDEVYSGFITKVHEYANQYLHDSTGEEAINLYMLACNKLRAELTAQGFDLEGFATQIEYVVNPLATMPFPKAELATGYVKVWEFDLTKQTFDTTYDWTQLPKPE